MLLSSPFLISFFRHCSTIFVETVVSFVRHRRDYDDVILIFPSDCFIFHSTMPQKKGKAGKCKRRGKNKNNESHKRELVTKEEGQEYAQIVKMLGNCRFEAFCFDGQTRICHVRGTHRNKLWMNRDDIILVGLRDFQDEKCDAIHRYTADEARRLKNMGELPAKTRIGADPVDGDEAEEDFDIVDFDDESDKEEKEEVEEEINLDDI